MPQQHGILSGTTYCRRTRQCCYHSCIKKTRKNMHNSGSANANLNSKVSIRSLSAFSNMSPGVSNTIVVGRTRSQGRIVQPDFVLSLQYRHAKNKAMALRECLRHEVLSTLLLTHFRIRVVRVAGQWAAWGNNGPFFTDSKVCVVELRTHPPDKQIE